MHSNCVRIILPALATTFSLPYTQTNADIKFKKNPPTHLLLISIYTHYLKQKRTPFSSVVELVYSRICRTETAREIEFYTLAYQYITIRNWVIIFEN